MCLGQTVASSWLADCWIQADSMARLYTLAHRRLQRCCAPPIGLGRWKGRMRIRTRPTIPL